MRFLTTDFWARVVGAAVGAVVLGALGPSASLWVETDPIALTAIMALIGLLAGLVLTPFFTTRPVRYVRRRLVEMPPERLGAILLGVFLGLVAAALFTVPLSRLPAPLGTIAPVIAAVLLCYFSVIIFSLRQNDLRGFFSAFQLRSGASAPADADQELDSILLDTSVIIDGRITDISKTGFIRSELIVPSFVLLELQHIADSPDTLRRNRGRRGMEVLRILQQESPIPVKVTDMDVSEVRDVDSKLVALARELRTPIMTNDYNLNRIAELQGVPVLNINDLANAVKAAFLPGEELNVRIIQEGKEYGQGVGYLEDGTMVVVEDGRNRINETVNVTVTKVLQTTAGRMVFARP